MRIVDARLGKFLHLEKRWSMKLAAQEKTSPAFHIQLLTASMVFIAEEAHVDLTAPDAVPYHGNGDVGYSNCFISEEL